jgi:hypothetical protein
VSRPSWCPHSDCVWRTGGGNDSDTGVACGGELPDPELHEGTPNTHRLCIRTLDGEIGDYQLNHADLWYLGRIIEKLRGLGVPVETRRILGNSPDSVRLGEPATILNAPAPGSKGEAGEGENNGEV